MLASPFGTIHSATFSFPQPVGTLIPEPPAAQLASVGITDPETTGALGRGDDSGGVPLNRPRVDFPTVNRRLKGDLTGEVLIAAMQASPHRDVEFEPRRADMPVREVFL